LKIVLKSLLIITILAGLTIAMMGAVSGCSSEQSGSPESEPIKVDIKAFLEEFNVDKTAALEKYKGKTIQTSGYVSYMDVKTSTIGSKSGVNVPIAQNPPDVIYGATVGSFGKMIICDMEKSKASTLATHQLVTISGIVYTSAMGSVIVRNCSVVE